MAVGKREGYAENMTAIYSILHLLVDGICALAMFGSFLLDENGYFGILIYNFCAFALQMPLGILLDMVNGYGKRGEYGSAPAFWTAVAGVLLTMAGAFLHPAVLGLGNALFHVGGGVGCIREDGSRNWKGRGLGVFVAPGALGLYLGTWMAKQGVWREGYLGAGVFAVLLCLGTWLALKRRDRNWEVGEEWQLGAEKRAEVEKKASAEKRAEVEKRAPGLERPEEAVCGPLTLRRPEDRPWMVGMAVCCLLVVVLRSYIGMAVAFPWKGGFWAGWLAVLAVAGGKAAGGFGAARWGAVKTSVLSLGLAALCYLFSAWMPLGLAGLFLFNMTMPVTLYWMVSCMPQMPGLAFGFLTFALFLGFLPGYFGLSAFWEDGVTGCAGCVLSMLLLLTGMKTGMRGRGK